MALDTGDLAGEMKSFILETNKMTQEDAEKAIENYCAKLEEVVYKAIKSIIITIPQLAIQVEGTPAKQTNVNQIVLKGVVS